MSLILTKKPYRLRVFFLGHYDGAESCPLSLLQCNEAFQNISRKNVNIFVDFSVYH